MQAGTDHSHCPATSLERSTMRCGVDAGGKSAHDRDSSLRQARGYGPRNIYAPRARMPGSYDRDPFRIAVTLASSPHHEWWPLMDRAQLRGVFPVKEGRHQDPLLPPRTDLLLGRLKVFRNSCGLEQ
jgi:hypothetical protein